MSQFDVVFERMSFTQFIRMPLDQYKVYGDEFVSRYAELLDRIEALVRNALLDDFKPPGTFKLDEPERKSLSVTPTRSTWVPENNAEFFNDDDDPPMQHTNATRNPDRPLTGRVQCKELFNVSLDENAQVLDVCSHRVGECDRHDAWFARQFVVD